MKYFIDNQIILKKNTKKSCEACHFTRFFFIHPIIYLVNTLPLTGLVYQMVERISLFFETQSLKFL